MAEETVDTRFALPAVDAPASTEIGVILSGLAADRLLAGLGAATAGDDPAAVTLLVDRLRHGDAAALADALAVGARRWRAARTALDRAAFVSASIRQAWERALRTASGIEIGADRIGPAGRAYLAACWLRRDDVDAAVARLSARSARTGASA